MKFILQITFLLGFLSIPLKAEVSKKLIEEVAEECDVPASILEAVCRVESGLKSYTLNVSGKPYFFKTKGEAIRFLKESLGDGKTNIDMGCMQINWYWHGRHLKTPEVLLDDKACLYYGAKLLRVLAQEKGGWIQGVKYYHSKNPQAQEKYIEKFKDALRMKKSEESFS